MTARHLPKLAIIVLSICSIWFLPPYIMERQGVSQPYSSLFERGSITLHNGGAGEIQLAIAMAQSVQAMQQGMMHRKEWGDIDGMLFMFEKPRVLSFWMRNTYLPLDIVFFDSDGTLVHMIERTKPLSDAPLSSLLPAQYALELPAGDAERMGLNNLTVLALPPISGYHQAK